MNAQKASGYKTPDWLILVLVLVLLAIAAGGQWFYHTQRQQVRQTAEQEMQAIADLKVKQIADWRADQLGEGTELISDDFFIQGVARWLATTQAEDTVDILNRFRALQKHFAYHDVVLVDPAGRPRLSLSGRLEPLHAAVMQVLAEAVRDRKAVVSDLHTDGDRSPHIGVLTPLFPEKGTVARPVAAVLFEQDAAQFLFPLVQAWPTPSRSAETLLVRRDGDSVLFLNELRHQSNTALKLRFPLSQTNLPAVMAVQGREGIVQGRDYRGHEVLSALKAIPASPWYMVAKVDQDELFAVWQTQSLLILLLIFTLAACAAALIFLGWHRHAKAHYRTLYHAEARYQLTLRSIGDAVISTDAAGRVALVNPVAESLTGWTEAEARGKHLDEIFRIFNEETRQVVESPVAKVLRAGRVVGLANHTVLAAKDGTERPIADAGAPIRDELGRITGVVLVFRDQTAERATAAAQRASELRYRRLFESAKDGILILDAGTGLVVDVNPFLIELLGLTRAMFLGKKVWELGFFKDAIANEDNFRELQQKGYVRYENLALEGSDGKRHEVEFVSNVYLVHDRKVIQCNIRDITERRRAEKRAELTRDLLAILNRPNNISNILRDMLLLFQREAGIEAVGIRLREGEEFPYAATNGFPAGFVKLDNHLCARDATGRIRRDEEGRPVLACMCGNVIYGRTDAAPPFFTAAGSFWTNSTTDLLAAPATCTLQLCHGTDYESVALIPLRAGGEIIGLLQLNDHRRNQFTPERITFLEGIGNSIGIALFRLRMDDAVRESEERYRSLVEHSPDMIGVLVGGRVAYVNPAGLTLFGAGRPEQMLNKAIADYVHPDDLPMIRERIQQAGMIVQPNPLAELRIRRLDGTYVAIEGVSTPISFQGQPAVQFICRDITERQQAAKALQENEAKYRTLVENIPQKILLKDRDSRFVSVNANFARDLDLAPEAMAGKTDYDFFPKELADQYRADDQRVMQTGQTREVEEKYMREGRATWVRTIKTPVRDATGQITGIFGIFWDITRRKQAQQRDQLARAVLEVLNRVDQPAASIRDILNLIKQYTGLEAVGIRLRQGDDFPYFVQAGFSDDFLLAENMLLAHDGAGGLCRDKDGNISLECTCGLVISGRTDSSRPLFTAGGSFWTNHAGPLLELPADQDSRLPPRNRCIRDGFLSMALIPLRSGNEIIGLLQLNDHRPDQFTLETIQFFEGLSNSIGIALARMRTAEEHDKLEAQLRQAAKLEAVGLLAGGVAHDFNNKLQIILGYTDFILNQIPPEHPFRADLQDIQQAAHQSASLTQQLLAFSRQQTIAPVLVDLNVAISHNLNMLARLVGENIRVNFTATQDVWPVWLDATQLDQILTNLVVNARDAIAGTGAIAIAVATCTLHAAESRDRADFIPPGDYVVLTFRDSGVGMTPEIQARIFEPFFTTKVMGKGSGLGLATVYGIVKQNHGAITVESAPGQGTAFSVYLPRAPAAAPAAATATATQLPTGTETVLVTEDEGAVLSLVQRTLAQQGYKVITAMSPHVALDWCRHNTEPVHLLLTDVIMPDISGKELAEGVQALRPNIRVLYMSGYTAEVMEQKGHLPEGLHVLQKPFTAAALTQSVRAELDGVT